MLNIITTQLNEFKILDKYAPLFYSTKPYYLLYGGRSSGKSTQAAAYFLIMLFQDDYFRGVISRYSAKSIKFSIYRDILDLAEQWKVKDYLQIKGDEILNTLNGNQIITHSFRLADGTMTAKGKGLANVTHLIIDEAQELDDEEEYIKVIDSFRTKEAERKIFICFNPSSKLHWIHKRWFIDGKPNPKWFIDHEFIYSTYKDNLENIDPTKVAEWERMKDIDPEYYEHHILGNWREAFEGKIYRDWIFDYNPPEDAEVLYGIDYGYSNDPTACVKILRKGKDIWLKEILYKTGLTNQDLYIVLSNKGVGDRDTIVADSSEPKSTEELRRAGFKRITLSKKGPGSVISGIKKVASCTVHCDPYSTNLINEYNSYVWKVDKDVPEDRNNHLMDAIRYALSLDKLNSTYSAYGPGLHSRHRQIEQERDMYA